MRKVAGWVLIGRDVNGPHDIGPWHIAWHEIFFSRREARAFAINNRWGSPWKAVRGSLSVSQQEKE